MKKLVSFVLKSYLLFCVIIVLILVFIGLTWGLDYTLILMGYNSYWNKSYKKTMLFCDASILLNKSNPDPYFLRGKAEFALKDYDKATLDVKKAVEFRPKNHSFQNLLSLTEIDKQVKLIPGDTSLLLKRGILYIDSFEFEKAIDDFNAILEKDDKNSEAYYLRGLAFLKMGDHHFSQVSKKKDAYMKSIVEFDKAISIKPDYSQAYFCKAQALEKLERNQEALNAYKKFLKLGSYEDDGNIEYAKEKVKALGVSTKTK
jgi:tetratricopeptide (TPR) repeat protein